MVPPPGKGIRPSGQARRKDHFHRKQGGASFFPKKGLYGHVGTIPHYSGRAARHRGKEITDENKETYREFAAGIQTLSGCSCSPDHVWERDCESEEVTPTESQKRLMFDYMVRFERLREQERSGWKYWHLKWERRMTST